MENITQPWQVVFIGVVGLGAAVVICVWFWLGVRGSEPDDAGPIELIRRDWQAFSGWRPLSFMSHQEPAGVEDAIVAAPVAATSTTTRQPIATPDNAVNAALSGNAVDGVIPSEARDIIRMQAKAEIVAKLLTTAKFTNKAEAIEFVFDCSRSGRPNSTYQQALALVEPLINRYPQRTAEQKGARQELGLPA